MYPDSLYLLLQNPAQIQIQTNVFSSIFFLIFNKIIFK